MRLIELEDDILLNLHLYKLKNGKYLFNNIQWILYKKCNYCNEPYFGKIDNKGFCSNQCSVKYRIDPEKISLKLFKQELYSIPTNEKFCWKCKTIKSKSDFWKNKGMCKNCYKEDGQTEKGKLRYKQYRESDKGKAVHKKYKYSDKGRKVQLNHNNSYILWENSSYIDKIKPYEEIRQNNEFLEVKCTYCGKWYKPKKCEIKRRILVINGNRTGESRLYCSNNCKKECPIYNQNKYPKGYKKATSREVQPELRQLVLERDNYTCQKCFKVNVPLHCHHKEGILWEPIESADIDICITYCKTCHKEVHKIEGCGYNDMKCEK